VCGTILKLDSPEFRDGEEEVSRMFNKKREVWELASRSHLTERRPLAERIESSKVLIFSSTRVWQRTERKKKRGSFLANIEEGEAKCGV